MWVTFAVAVLGIAGTLVGVALGPWVQARLGRRKGVEDRSVEAIASLLLAADQMQAIAQRGAPVGDEFDDALRRFENARTIVEMTSPPDVNEAVGRLYFEWEFRAGMLRDPAGWRAVNPTADFEEEDADLARLINNAYDDTLQRARKMLGLPRSDIEANKVWERFIRSRQRSSSA